MGVKGLWRLLDGTGRPLNLESLDGKVLAIDISVWLNMAIKGMRDYQGHESATAHLTTLFNRICKLLYYGVKPVFVFDGQAPMLKQKTLRERRERKTYHANESKKASAKILQTFLKKQILQEATGVSSNQNGDDDADKATSSRQSSKVGKVQEKDIFDLPPLASQLNDSDQDELEEELKMRTELQNEYFDETGQIDVGSVLSMNIDSQDFNSLPSDVQYELLKDLKEIRKRRRTKIEAMPEESNSFSDYQIAGLLAKRKISKKIEHVENKMSEENLAASSLHAGFTDQMMKDHVVDARQLVSDSSTHFIWMRKSDKKFNKVDEDTKDSTLPGIPEEPPTDSDDISIKSPQSQVKTDNLSSFIRNIPEMVTKEVPVSAIITKDQQVINADAKLESPAINQSQSSEISTSIMNAESQSPKPNHLQEENTSPNASKSICGETTDILLPTPSNHDFTTSNSTQTQFPKDINRITISSECTIKDNHNDSKSGTIISEPISLNRSTEITTESDAVTQKLGKDILQSTVAVKKNTLQMSEHFSESVLKRTGSEKGSDICESSDDDEFIDIPEPLSNTQYEKDELSVPTDSVLNEITANISSNNKPAEESDVVQSNPWEGLNANNIEAFSGQLDAEGKELKKLMQAKERAARDLSQSAQLECQELLQLFGLPFITSPQEAEAQCAALELLGLTNGTITEDSDIWLFGGKYVIKDMFGNKRDPVVFTASDIEMQLGLNRDRFICIALCSGSDYTTGIHGVGPVTALEILKEFTGDGIQGLITMRKWWDEMCASTKHVLPVETKIKSQLRKFSLNKDFPSEAVYKAYTQPIIDDTDTKFEWGFPDLDDLRSFAINTMGWTRLKVDELLLPLMKKLGQRRSTQLKVTQFLTAAPLSTTNKKKSKRVRRAVASLTNKDVTEDRSKRKKPRKVKVQPVIKDEVLNLSASSSGSE